MKSYSGKEVVSKLKKAGWYVSRQKGSHIMMENDNYQYTIAIPQHKELGIGLIRSIIKQTGLSIDEFEKL